MNPVGINTTVVRKVAVVINGDTGAEHLKNVNDSVRELLAMGYEVHVASTQPPETAVSQFVTATPRHIQQMLAQLKTDTNDDVVIYTTGHAIPSGDFCLDEDCETGKLTTLLAGLAYGQRVVIMDQCSSANLRAQFVDTERTLFISAGSKNETVCCHRFAPKFWSHLPVMDANHDGVINWQERLAYANQQGANVTSLPQFTPTAGYVMPGTPPFTTTVKTVRTSAELSEQLGRLQPGQYAFVMFSADWCGYCPKYLPSFQAQAVQAGGQYLFLVTENVALAAANTIDAFPTVAIFDHEQKLRREIPNSAQESVTRELAGVDVPMHELIGHHRAQIQNPHTPEREVDNIGYNYVHMTCRLPSAETAAEMEKFRAWFLAASPAWQASESRLHIYRHMLLDAPIAIQAAELTILRDHVLAHPQASALWAMYRGLLSSASLSLPVRVRELQQMYAMIQQGVDHEELTRTVSDAGVSLLPYHQRWLVRASQKSLEDSHPMVRVQAARILLRLTHDAALRARVVTVLQPLINDANVRVATLACRALSDCSDFVKAPLALTIARAALPLFGRVADPTLRLEALRLYSFLQLALVRYHRHAVDIATLVNALSDPSPEIIETAALTLMDRAKYLSPREAIPVARALFTALARRSASQKLQYTYLALCKRLKPAELQQHRQWVDALAIASGTNPSPWRDVIIPELTKSVTR